MTAGRSFKRVVRKWNTGRIRRMKMDKLKQCPFCGGRSVWSYRGCRIEGGAYFAIVKCMKINCNAETSGWGTDKKEAEADTTKRWNRREGE
jgi:hypothetical protein